MILIAVGANLPGPNGESVVETCAAAAEAVRMLPGTAFVACSAWYRTRPIPAAEQPDYCNGVVRLEGDASPGQLLAALHEIEKTYGRTRTSPNAPRSLDLDLIDVNGIVRTDPAPILPHPRAHVRAFVLRPILDVAPSWRHPTKHVSIVTMLAELPQQQIEPWGE